MHLAIASRYGGGDSKCIDFSGWFGLPLVDEQRQRSRSVASGMFRFAAGSNCNELCQPDSEKQLARQPVDGLLARVDPAGDPAGPGAKIRRRHGWARGWRHAASGLEQPSRADRHGQSPGDANTPE